jgi:hypothetical protein
MIKIKILSLKKIREILIMSNHWYLIIPIMMKFNKADEIKKEIADKLFCISYIYPYIMINYNFSNIH